MLAKKILFRLLIIVTVLSACTSTIDFDGEATAPKVVVHGFISPDSLVSAYVSLSTFFLNDTLQFKQIFNANVSLYVNGEFKEKMNSVYTNRIAMYRGTYRPKVTDKLKIVVKVPEMEEVYAETAFCTPPVIQSVDTTKKIESILYSISAENETISVDYGCKLNIEIKFTDNEREKNFYRLVVMTKSYYYEPRMYLDSLNWEWKKRLEEFSKIYYNRLDFTDPATGNSSSLNPLDEISSITGEMISAAETYNVFSDELINGKTYTLNCTANNISYLKRTPGFEVDSEKGKLYYYSVEKSEVFVCLQAISEEYYYYLKTRGASAKDDFFAEPIQIISNIHGGIGFIGAYTTSNIFSYVVE